jgi:spoIIIJ-associated protein
MAKDKIKIAEAKAQSLLASLEIEAQVTVEEDKENNLIRLFIDSPEAAGLIGFHGETLQAIQLILSFMVHQELEEWIKLQVDVSGYRQKREEQLQKLALNLAMKAKFSGETQMIPNLLASERRFVHLVLADHPEVESFSEGEGKQRVLMIKPK